MKKYINIGLSILWIIIFSSTSQSKDNIDFRKEMAECAAIENSVERLTAYDNLAEKMGVAAHVSTTVKGKGKWELRTDVSKIDDTESYYLSLLSEDEAPGRFGKKSQPILVIRYMEKSLNIFINYDNYLGLGDTEVTTRIDKEEAETTSWNISTNGEAIFSQQPKSLIDSLINKNTLIVRLTPYGENPITVSFDLRGLKDAIKPILKAMGDE